MVGPLRHLQGSNGRTLFCILFVVSLLFVASSLLPGLRPTLTPHSAPTVPESVNQSLQAHRQPRAQPNYLEHAEEGQAYMHKLLVQSGGNFDRLNADDQSFVEAVLGGHAHRYFPMMYRGMTSKTKPGTAASSNHGRSSDTN